MNRVLEHLRSNLIAYLALFVALGGTSYATLNLPAGSVGAAQIENNSITPSKLDSSRIAGTVRHWVHVSATGRVLASSGPVKVVASTGAGAYQLTWKDADALDKVAKCVPVVTVDSFGGQVPPAGGQSPTIGDASVFRSASKRATTAVVTIGNANVALAGSFYIALICG